MHILGIDIQGEVTLVDKEWTRVEKRDSDIVFKNENPRCQTPYRE